jgi:hypothetical protein
MSKFSLLVRTLAVGVLASTMFPHAAFSQGSAYCNERCSGPCERHGWNSESCVSCNVTCSQGSGGTDERWRSKCQQWRSDGNSEMDRSHRRDVCRNNGFGY